MSSDARVDAAVLISALAGCWILFSWLYRDYRIDLFRQRLFTLRDELFDTARDGALEFSHPAYKTTRALINGFIRFANRLGLLTLVMHRPYSSHEHLDAAGLTPFDRTWAKQVETLSPDARARLTSIVSRVHQEVVEQLIMTSAVLLLLVIPALFAVLIRTLGLGVFGWLRHSQFWVRVRVLLLNPIDSAAFLLGSNSSGPAALQPAFVGRKRR